MRMSYKGKKAIIILEKKIKLLQEKMTHILKYK